MAQEKEPILYLDDEEANLIAFRMTLGDRYNVFLAEPMMH